MKCHVYVDGFNLYHGCLQRSKYKWLNLLTLARNMVAGHEIEMVKFFTAKISGTPGDPDQPNRQMIYWRALRTLEPSLEIIEGSFQENERWMRVAPTCRLYRPNQLTMMRVIKRDEKGSDVNLATHLLMDGWNRKFEQAVVITNDADLAMPFSVVRNEMNLPLFLINPHEFHSKKLKKHASSLARIRPSDLAAAQFDPTLVDKKGAFRKPAIW
jgi:NYN domain